MEECKICLKVYKNVNSLRSHINRCHGLSFPAYRRDYLDEKRECMFCGFDITSLNHKAKICGSKECKSKRSVLMQRNYSDRVTEERYKDKEEYIDYVVCKVCWFKSSNIQKHIKDRHGMTIKQYQNKYNCDISLIYSVVYRETLSKKNSGKGNGAYGHNGKYSPFSKRFVKYDGLSNEDVDAHIDNIKQKQKQSLVNNKNMPNQLEHWTKRGYTQEQAVNIVSERQTTFSLSICIEKYGEEEGRKRWKERQEKWQNNLKSKPPEEIERINRSKFDWGNNTGYSKVSQDMFWSLYKDIKDDFDDIYFAQLGSDRKKDDSGKNHEYFSILPDRNAFFDFFIKDINKIIEFDGDYWHGEARGNVKRDKERNEAIKKEGYEILHIKERDWKSSHGKVIQKCLEFIYG